MQTEQLQIDAQVCSPWCPSKVNFIISGIANRVNVKEFACSHKWPIGRGF